jgi:hypothetical protein
MPRRPTPEDVQFRHECDCTQVLHALRQTPGGLTRTAFHELFRRRLKGAEIGALLADLADRGLIKSSTARSDRGCLIERWWAVDPQASVDLTTVLARSMAVLSDDEKAQYNRQRRTASDLAATVLRRICLVQDGDPLAVELLPATARQCEELAGIVESMPWLV